MVLTLTKQHCSSWLIHQHLHPASGDKHYSPEIQGSEGNWAPGHSQLARVVKQRITYEGASSFAARHGQLCQGLELFRLHAPV